MIVGTAGHIDHGKTALVKALTGVDTDRLKEEKARGITIDLGFAYLAAPGDGIIGFVDVPGHERFVHTMLAGASGIDVALLAVAADDGVKSQTREHVAIMDLLGIRQGIVALTKCDLAGPARVQEVADDIRRLLEGTSLSAAEILPVSTLTGEGVETLRQRLFQAATDATGRSAEGAFRLPVDRCFTLPGAGIVVTGTVVSGSVRLGDRIAISPSGLTARIRSLHVQNRAGEEARAGARCALNLAGDGVAKDAIGRGDVVVDPALHAPTDRIDAQLRLLQAEKKDVGQWFPARLHHAATQVGARILLLDRERLAPGETAMAQLVLDRPIAAAQGDVFVIRDVSAQRTLGGGRFLDLHAPARKRRTPERQEQLSALALPDAAPALSALLAVPPHYCDWKAFVRDRALSRKNGHELAQKLTLVTLETGTSAIAMLPACWDAFRMRLIEMLEAFHAENPDAQGFGRERLRLALQPRLPSSSFMIALDMLARDGHVMCEGAFVRLASHTVRLTREDEALWSQTALMLGGDARFRPPRTRDIAQALKRSEADTRRLLKLSARLGHVDEVAHDHFFLRESVREMLAIAAKAGAAAPDGMFTAAQFRDRLDNGRKVAIQILEFFDRHGATFRHGDLRRVNRHRLDLFGPVALNSNGTEPGRDTFPVGRPDFKSGWGSETVLRGFDSHSLPPTPK